MTNPSRMVELTEAERTELELDLQDYWHEADLMGPPQEKVIASVARIVAAREIAAEQAGREDNALHEMCYVSGSKALEAREAAARREALLAFADTRGVNVGDEDTEWWQGYRQAQRECLHDATKAALAEPERDEESSR